MAFVKKTWVPGERVLPQIDFEVMQRLEDGIADAGGSGFSGSYDDLTDKPTIPSAPADIGAATAAQGANADTAVQPGDLSTVATSGSYDDLSNKPTIPAAYTLPAATTGAIGGVKQAAVPATEDFAGLIAVLQAAGIVASA